MISPTTRILRATFSSKLVALPDGPSLEDFIEAGNLFQTFF